MCDDMAVLSSHWLAFLFLIQISEVFAVASLITFLSVVSSAQQFVVIIKQLLADAQLGIAAILWLYFNSLSSLSWVMITAWMLR